VTIYVHVEDDKSYAKRFGTKRGFRGSDLYDRDTGRVIDVPKKFVPSKPYVIPDIPTHIGPSGQIVRSRSEQREEFKRSGTRIFEPIDKRPRGYINPRFAAKHGANINHNAREYEAEQTAQKLKSLAQHREAMSLLANSKA
jgi:hypothetical protein